MIKWDFVVDKPIFLVLHGLSAHELERRWKEFEKYDVLWGGINNCHYLGRWMTKPLDILVYYCTHLNIPQYANKHWLKSAEARGNSLFEFICQCDENNVNDLVLFGADGFSDNCQASIYDATPPSARDGHITDCEHFNANFPKDIKTKITNVSPNSHYGHMKKVSYDEFLGDSYYKQWLRT